MLIRKLDHPSPLFLPSPSLFSILISILTPSPFSPLPLFPPPPGQKVGFCSLCELQRHTDRTFNGGVVKPTKIVQNLKGVFTVYALVCTQKCRCNVCVYVIELMFGIEEVTLHCVTVQRHSHT